MRGGHRENTGRKTNSQNLHVEKPIPMPTVEYLSKDDLIRSLKANMERIVKNADFPCSPEFTFADRDNESQRLWDERRLLKHQLANYETEDPT